ncbi:ATP-dependent helicase [Hymenobacter aerilatus]|uniref:DNA 3'-5' helicase n=1 Tax=Hymenobacter aerilatus TaxID=2932251 RepID=A0A8T9SRZ4_9BACT|nr:ATP-dependent helicase [Hymenobacter aerilatus]UOR04882.1 ATP-dependent helicase [Hymenobacter aerilatus]
MPTITIDSNSSIDIEQHFRVSAGPGAGKTHWLINHIKNVLHESKRLQKTRKIACITYTNIGAETIKARLGIASIQVEVDTIHSFLYEHVLKPYLSFIDTAHGLCIERVRGHDDEIIRNYGFLDKWKIKTKQTRIPPKDNLELIYALQKAQWKLNTNGELVISASQQKVGTHYLKTSSYYDYKTMAWAKGVLHHDDVLFFSYDLVIKHPFILDVLRAKFPYFFIDEFQDTNPIQTKILKLIGNKESIIGVIGDKSQSIYGFQGANYDTFDSFDLNGIVNYQILTNRRSTNQIIDLLNTIRKDINQSKFKNQSGPVPVILVGSMKSALTRAQAICSNELIHSLTYRNIVANTIKKQANETTVDKELLDKLMEIDRPSSSNKYRSSSITALIKATELAIEGRFKDSIRILEKAFKAKPDLEATGNNIIHIIHLLNRYEEFKNKTLYEYYLFIKNEIGINMSNLREGGIARDFYDGHTYKDLALCVNIPDDNGLFRTIHKSKGAEFDNVLLILDTESNLTFITNPDLTKEQHRVRYVAVSRAKNRLFITVPTLSEENSLILSKMGLDIETLT